MQVIYENQAKLPGSVADEVENIIGVSAMTVNPTYSKAIGQAAEKYVRLVELPIKTSLNTPLFPLDGTLVRKRISHCVEAALNDGVEVAPTAEGVYNLICGHHMKYNIMLDRNEERALIKGIQTAKEIGDDRSTERLQNIVITFLTGRMRPIYASVKSILHARSIQEDVAQEMYLALFDILEQFDLTRTSAGLTPAYMDGPLIRAARGTIHDSYEMIMAEETWEKIMKFDRTQEDHNLSISDIAAKYKVSTSLAETMVAFARSNTFFMSVDYKAETGDDDTPTTRDKLVSPVNDYSVTEMYIMLEVLSPAQREIVKLKMDGYSHQEIADMLGYESKRAEQYQYKQAKITLAQALELDPNLYSGLKRLRV